MPKRDRSSHLPYLHKQKFGWVVMVNEKGKKKHLGTFASEEEAKGCAKLYRRPNREQHDKE